MKKRYTEEQIIRAIKQNEAGTKVDGICREKKACKYVLKSVRSGSGPVCPWQYRQLPHTITADNGTEFTSKAMFFWSKETGTKLGFIQSGKPTQNAFIESLNGKLRNECLNQHWFRRLEEARFEIDRWHDHYNNVRPHSSLGYLPPVEFARSAA